ncbi:MAG: hypothetical protein AAF242_05270 [Bacteroidota bacterium]
MTRKHYIEALRDTLLHQAANLDDLAKNLPDDPDKITEARAAGIGLALNTISEINRLSRDIEKLRLDDFIIKYEYQFAYLRKEPKK